MLTCHVMAQFILLLLALFSSCCHHASATEQKILKEHFVAPAPWRNIISKAYIFQVSPLASAPTADKLYPPGLPAWHFAAGPGYIMVVQYSSTPVGPYNELVYVPGSYQPGNCSSSYLSVGRIWVDSEASLIGGRQYYGMPKHLATFRWTDLASGGDKIEITAASGQLILSAAVEPMRSLLPNNKVLTTWPAAAKLLCPFAQLPLDSPLTHKTKPIKFQLAYFPTGIRWGRIMAAKQSPSTTNHSTPLDWTVNFEQFTGKSDLQFYPLPQGKATGLALASGSVGYFRRTKELKACPVGWIDSLMRPFEQMRECLSGLMVPPA